MANRKTMTDEQVLVILYQALRELGRRGDTASRQLRRIVDNAEAATALGVRDAYCGCIADCAGKIDDMINERTSELQSITP